MILFGIRKPIEVILTYQVNHNYFGLKIKRQKDVEVSSAHEAEDRIVISSDESEDESVIADVDNVPDGDTYTLLNMKTIVCLVGTWELTVTEAYARDINNQVLHIPPRTAEYVLRKRKSIVLKTQHNFDGTI
ncbi:hypothetical protein P8452_56346 [Trifolium repens]|nr:hypothetical protein P8452_56346 [Trifolium repens]